MPAKGKKIKFYEKEVRFFEKKLKNKNFIDKAPINVVNENRAKLKDALKKSRSSKKIIFKEKCIKLNLMTSH